MLANVVGVAQSTVSKKKKNNIFPEEWAYRVSKKYNLPTEWILTGEEIKRKEQKTDEHTEIKEKNYVECSWNRKIIKRVPIIIGGLYEIDPINPRAKKLRGERVIITGYEPIGPVTILRIDSNWHTSRREFSEIEACDLQLIDKNPDLTKLGFNKDLSKK